MIDAELAMKIRNAYLKAHGARGIISDLAAKYGLSRPTIYNAIERAEFMAAECKNPGVKAQVRDTGKCDPGTCARCDKTLHLYCLSCRERKRVPQEVYDSTEEWVCDSCRVLAPA